MRTFAIFASVLMLTIVAVPMAAAETDYEYYDETQLPTPEITLYDLAGSEIEIIDGSPYIIVETEDGYVNIPFPLSNTMDMMVDGVPITIEIDGNYLLIPTEDGIERVCISEFDVELIDGNLMLVHEENPILIKVLLIKVGISTVASKVYIRMLELASRRDICWWCELRIKGAGMAATFLWSKIMSKLGVEFIRHMSLDAVASSLVGTLQFGVLARTIAMTANVIGLCGNTNCLFHRNNH